MVLEADCVASESVFGGWTVEDSVLETWSDPEVSLLQAEKLKRSIPARKKEKIRFMGVLLPDCYDRLRLSSHSCTSPSLTLERKIPAYWIHLWKMWCFHRQRGSTPLQSTRKLQSVSS
jgi:hypothetical protein